MDFLLNVVTRFPSGEMLPTKMSILIVNVAVASVPGPATIKSDAPLVHVNSLLMASI